VSPSDSVEKTIEWMIEQQLNANKAVQDDAEPEELVGPLVTPDDLEADAEGLRAHRD
jgi:hypothetical protein